jgi:hypothetical protein
MNRIFIGFAALALLCAPALALSIPVNQGIKIKYSNWENVSLDTTVGSGTTLPGGTYLGDNYGIFSITSMTVVGQTTAFWNAGEGGVYLNGFFWGFDVQNNEDAVGGFIEVWKGTTALDADPSSDGNGSDEWGESGGKPTYPTVNEEGQTLFLRGIAGTGARPGAFPATLAGTFASTTAPISGTALSYYDIDVADPGSHGLQFDNDIFSIDDDLNPETPNVKRDLFAAARFPAALVPLYGWTTTSDDPVTAYYTPEPGTMALLGLGLLGLGYGARRKLRRKA